MQNCIDGNVTKKEAVLKAERKLMDLENGSDVEFQDKQYRTPFNQNLPSKLKEIPNPIDQEYSFV